MIKHATRIVMLLGLIFCVNAAYADIKLAFGVYAADKPTVMVRKFKPLLKSLEKSLSEKFEQPVKIKLQIASTYAAGISDIVTGRVDFARLGPASYIEAKFQQPNLQILALEAQKGKKTFNGVIIVASDSPIKTIGDLRGKRFAFGNKRSTIGRYLSQQYLMQHDIYGSDLGSYDYLDRHDKVGTAVSVDQFDAGALKESTFKRLVKKGADLRVLASFPNVTKPWISRAGLDPDIASALRISLLQLKNPKSLKALKKGGLVEGTDNDFEIIRQAIERNSQFFD